MTANKPILSGSKELRVRAEQKLSESFSTDNQPTTVEESRRAIHELRVHQIELEMQNEQLRRTEVELELSKARYKELFEEAPVGYVTLDQSGLILEANMTFARLLGTIPAALIRNQFDHFVVLDDRDLSYKFRRRVMSGGTSQSFELCMIGAGSAPFWARLDMLRSKDKSDAPMYLVAISDVSDRRRAESELDFTRAAFLQQLTKEKTAAESANQAKSVFLANMSHEIRTPMNGVLGLTQLLLDSDLTSTQREDLEAIRQSGEVLLHVINEILDFSKIEIGKVDLELVAFDLRSLFGALQTVNRAKVFQRKLGLDVIIDDRIPKSLVGDPTRLSQVLSNLLSNALKFSLETGAVLLGVELLQETTQTAGLRFYVSDTGIGIPSDKQEKIFEPFFQADSSTTRTFGGTGLGLAISSELVRLMGGELSVRSQPGIGTTFTFDCTFGTQLPEIITPTSDGVRGAKQTLRILVAEDNVVNQRVIARMLEKAGHTLRIASDGAQATTIYEEDTFDVVLLDIEMPVKDGVQVAAEIRAYDRARNHRPTPIVAVTARAMASDRERYLNLGMDFYIPKPIDRLALLNLLEQIASNGTA